jgi:fatty acid-binding protein DegV
MNHEKVNIVTDSTACLSKEQINRYNIGVTPLTVSINKDNKIKSYKDGVDLDRATFTQMQKK